MANVNSSETLAQLREAAQLMQGKDATPSMLSNQVVPVIEVNPKLLRYAEIFKDNTAVNSASQTVYTTPNDGRDFYLTGFCVSLIKDATATSTKTYVTAYVNGELIVLGAIVGLTLTAQTGQLVVEFSRPVKIDRNKTIAVNNSTAVGNVSASIQIRGFLVNPTG